MNSCSVSGSVFDTEVTITKRVRVSTVHDAPDGVIVRKDEEGLFYVEEKAEKDILQKPFADYEDFDECVQDNQDKDDPQAYCAQIHYNATGEWPAEKSTPEGVPDDADYLSPNEDPPENAEVHESRHGGRYVTFPDDTESETQTVEGEPDISEDMSVDDVVATVADEGVVVTSFPDDALIDFNDLVDAGNETAQELQERQIEGELSPIEMLYAMGEVSDQYDFDGDVGLPEPPSAPEPFEVPDNVSSDDVASGNVTVDDSWDDDGQSEVFNAVGGMEDRYDHSLESLELEDDTLRTAAGAANGMYIPGDDTVQVSAAALEDDDIDFAVAGAPAETAVHEMAHSLDYDGDTTADDFGTQIRSDDWDYIEQEVSEYATTNRQEFVAEYVTKALMTDWDPDEKTRRLYAAVGGPEL